MLRIYAFFCIGLPRTTWNMYMSAKWSSLYSKTLVCRNNTRPRKGGYAWLTYVQTLVDSENVCSASSCISRLHCEVINELISLCLPIGFPHLQTCIVFILVCLTEWPLPCCSQRQLPHTYNMVIRYLNLNYEHRRRSVLKIYLQETDTNMPLQQLGI